MQHTLNKKEFKWLRKDLVVIRALENNKILTNSLLDYKQFYGDYICFNKFFLGFITQGFSTNSKKLISCSESPNPKDPDRSYWFLDKNFLRVFSFPVSKWISDVICPV